MVDIDHELVKSCRFQFHSDMVQKRIASNRNQRLWHGVRKWLQPGTQAGRKDQGFHLEDFLNVKLTVGNRYLYVVFLGKVAGEMFCAID